MQRKCDRSSRGAAQLNAGKSARESPALATPRAKWGRFWSPDPVRGNLLRPQSWNRYVYVLNNPMNLIDPMGLAQRSPGEQMGQGDTCDGTAVDGWCTGETITVSAPRPRSTGRACRQASVTELSARSRLALLAATTWTTLELGGAHIIRRPTCTCGPLFWRIPWACRWDGRHDRGVRIRRGAGDVDSHDDGSRREWYSGDREDLSEHGDRYGRSSHRNWRSHSAERDWTIRRRGLRNCRERSSCTVWINRCFDCFRTGFCAHGRKRCIPCTVAQPGRGHGGAWAGVANAGAALNCQ